MAAAPPYFTTRKTPGKACARAARPTMAKVSHTTSPMARPALKATAPCVPRPSPRAPPAAMTPPAAAAPGGPRAEGDRPLRAPSQHPRHDGGDAGPRGGGRDEQGGGENDEACE